MCEENVSSCSPRPNKWVSSRPLTWPWLELDTGVGGGVTFRHYSMFVSGTELPGPGTRGSLLQSTCHCVLCNPSWSPDSLEINTWIMCNVRILRLQNGVVLVLLQYWNLILDIYEWAPGFLPIAHASQFQFFGSPIHSANWAKLAGTATVAH